LNIELKIGLNIGLNIGLVGLVGLILGVMQVIFQSCWGLIEVDSG